MNKDLIINSSPEGVEIALLEEKKLVEIHNEKIDARWSVGDLYLGKVKKIIPGLNAAFVDVGFEKDAFLHYTDLSPYIKSIIKFTQQATADQNNQFDFSKFSLSPEIVKTGKISEVLSGKPQLLVQILKEPIAAKGPRLTCEISLAGRFVVLTPFNEIVAVSKKIHSSEERKRLQKILEAVRPKNFGIIVRTAAEGKTTAELHEDLLTLTKHWNNIQSNLKGAIAPTRIMNEESKTTSILRDLLNEDFNKIIVNDKKIYDITLSYLQRIAPQKAKILSMHSGDQAIFDQYGITKQVKSSFGKTVNLNSGAYLIIEHTEALHVIDVNSGFKSVSNNQEENALQTNLEAAEEIARQLRLRDLGGIIVIDFIDMTLESNREAVMRRLIECLGRDRTKHQVAEVTSLGLVQMTRKRVGQGLIEAFSTTCESCGGRGIHIHSEPVRKVALEKDMEQRYVPQDDEDSVESNAESNDVISDSDDLEIDNSAKEKSEAPKPEKSGKRRRRAVSSGVITPV